MTNALRLKPPEGKNPGTAALALFDLVEHTIHFDAMVVGQEIHVILKTDARNIKEISAEEVIRNTAEQKGYTAVL